MKEAEEYEEENDQPRRTTKCHDMCFKQLAMQDCFATTREIVDQWLKKKVDLKVIEHFDRKWVRMAKCHVR